MLEYKNADFYLLKLPHYVENSQNLKYGTDVAACFDVCAAISEPVTINPGERFKTPLGIKLAPPHPIWYRICSRSGLAVNHGIITIGGIIDCDYRGEVFAILLNTDTKKAYTINPGDKIAQIELPFPYRANFIEINEEEFDKLKTERSSGGFGSTGK